MSLHDGYSAPGGVGACGALPVCCVKGHLPRVLYVAALDPSLKFGSMEEQIYTLAVAFKERGSQFLPLFQAPLSAEAAARYHAAGLEAAWLDLERFDARTLFRLIALIRRHRIQVVHWNFYHPLNAYVWALTALQPGLRHYLTDHTSRGVDAQGSPVSPAAGSLPMLLRRVLFKRYNRVLGVSSFVVRYLEQQGIRSNLSCCTHFINTERFRPDAVARARVREEIGAKGRFVILVVGQLIRAKGVHVALQALSRLPESTVLWIVGDGEEAASLRSLCDGLSLQARVAFIGCRTDVAPYMQAADCLVVPSIWAEAAGLVVLEGLACGLPVVASAVGGIPEFVEDGRTGFLFPAGEDTVLAERIGRLAKDTEAGRQMGAEGRAAAVARFGTQARREAYLDLYRSSGRGR